MITLIFGILFLVGYASLYIVGVWCQDTRWLHLGFLLFTAGVSALCAIFLEFNWTASIIPAVSIVAVLGANWILRGSIMGFPFVPRKGTWKQAIYP